MNNNSSYTITEDDVAAVMYRMGFAPRLNSHCQWEFDGSAERFSALYEKVASEEKEIVASVVSIDGDLESQTEAAYEAISRLLEPHLFAVRKAS